MSLRTSLAVIALILGTINILLCGLAIFLGGGGEFIGYSVVCIVLVTFEAAYLDYKRLGYVPTFTGGRIE